MKKFLGLYLVSVLILGFSIPASSLPVTDGIYDKGEWKDAYRIKIELNIGIIVELYSIYTTTHAYYLALVPHDNSVNEVNLDPSEPHDYFGIEFDNNKDETIMGTSKSPDDTIMVNYEENTASDMYMADMKAYYDYENSGVDNTEGKAGYDETTGNLVFEISKPLQSNDAKGHDFDLVHGESYQIMIAFWDDATAHSAAAAFNKRIGNDQFITMIVGPPISQTASIIIALVFLVMLLGLAYLVSKYGLDGTKDKFSKMIPS